MTKYIYQQPDWPGMHWQPEALSRPLNEVRHKHSLLMHRMRGVDLHHRRDAVLRALTGFVLKSSEIEGEYLGTVQVRSSVARHLGLDSPMRSTVPAEVEKVVSMMLRATDSFLEKLTEGQLFEWHSDLFYGESVSKAKIAVGAWRNDSLGRMEVVSGPVGKFKVHYVAPKACTIGKEVRAFLDWFNTPQNTDLVLKPESTDGRREGWANWDEGAYKGESLGSIGTDVTRQRVFSSRTGPRERSMEAGNREMAE